MINEIRERVKGLRLNALSGTRADGYSDYKKEVLSVLEALATHPQKTGQDDE